MARGAIFKIEARGANYKINAYGKRSNLQD
jgi:hypothetical protein